jgi:hypothetical protein
VDRWPITSAQGGAQRLFEHVVVEELRVGGAGTVAKEIVTEILAALCGSRLSLPAG